jgi:hypothetical protein
VAFRGLCRVLRRILLGLILDFFDPDQVREFLERTFKSLKPGGLGLVNSGIADEERRQDEYALMVAFQLFIFCPEGPVSIPLSGTGSFRGR